MLNIRILLSELSASSGHSLLGRIWPLVLFAFGAVAVTALYFCLRGWRDRGKGRGKEDPNEREEEP